MLKADYLVKAIQKHKMDQAIVFCRTKLDCDNIERYMMKLSGGVWSCDLFVWSCDCHVTLSCFVIAQGRLKW